MKQLYSEWIIDPAKGEKDLWYWYLFHSNEETYCHIGLRLGKYHGIIALHVKVVTVDLCMLYILLRPIDLCMLYTLLRPIQEISSRFSLFYQGDLAQLL